MVVQHDELEPRLVELARQIEHRLVGTADGTVLIALHTEDANAAPMAHAHEIDLEIAVSARRGRRPSMMRRRNWIACRRSSADSTPSVHNPTRYTTNSSACTPIEIRVLATGINIEARHTASPIAICRNTGDHRYFTRHSRCENQYVAAKRTKNAAEVAIAAPRA